MSYRESLPAMKVVRFLVRAKEVDRVDKVAEEFAYCRSEALRYLLFTGIEAHERTRRAADPLRNRCPARVADPGRPRRI